MLYRCIARWHKDDVECTFEVSIELNLKNRTHGTPGAGITGVFLSHAGSLAILLGLRMSAHHFAVHGKMELHQTFKHPGRLPVEVEGDSL
jgi:hypothetical protein